MSDDLSRLQADAALAFLIAHQEEWGPTRSAVGVRLLLWLLAVVVSALGVCLAVLWVALNLAVAVGG